MRSRICVGLKGSRKGLESVTEDGLYRKQFTNEKGIPGRRIFRDGVGTVVLPTRRSREGLPESKGKEDRSL